MISMMIYFFSAFKFLNRYVWITIIKFAIYVQYNRITLHV